MKRYAVAAMLSVSLPLPFAAFLTYKPYGLGAMMFLVITWLTAAVVYWLPLGLLLVYWKRGNVSKMLVGLIASIPLCIAYLAIVYPGFGYTFSPSSTEEWFMYMASGPEFFLIAVLLYYLVRNEGLLSRATQIILVLGCAGGLAIPPIIIVQSIPYSWPTPQQQRVRITGASIVVASHDSLITGHNVLIDSGRIVSIIPAFADTSEWKMIDATGKYLIPGLIDVHTHLGVPVKGVFVDFDFGFLVNAITTDYSQHRRAYIESGVTTIRDLGGTAKTAYSIRQSLRDRTLLGPRMQVVGRLVTSPGGHPASTIWSAPITKTGAILADNEAELVDGLNANLDEGPPDAIKLVYGTISRAPTRLRKDLLSRGIEWAADHNLPSLVHAETIEEVTDAVYAGATGIEHTASVDSMPDSVISEMVRRQTFVDPTFGELWAAARLSGSTEDEADELVISKYDYFRRMYQMGVQLVIGTDAPLVAYGAGLHDEMDRLVAAGIPSSAVLKIATINNARYLGLGDEIGKIEPGFLADLILVNSNPLEQLDALRSPTMVMLEGVVVTGRE